MKFKKKPVIIEATQWFKEGDHPEVKRSQAVRQKPNSPGVLYQSKNYYIKTLEGDMLVTPGDWIITGVKGEHYAVKPDIFEMTYEPLEPSLGSAKGTKGCLLRSMADGLAVFRVYDAEHNFRDYEVVHHDVEIIIDDDSAWFYEHDGEFYLDYSPDVLTPSDEDLAVYDSERLVSKYDKGAIA